MTQRKLQRVSPLYEQAYSTLTEMIVNEQLLATEKLTDGGLAEMLGISRTPVREAVRQLVREGLLVGAPNRSVTVFRPTLKDIAEIYSIRSTLEGLAARLAFLNPRKAAFIQEMRKCLELSQHAVSRGDSSASARLNTKFHDCILQASGNQNLFTLFESIKNKVMICRMTSLKDQTKMNIALDEHYGIVDSLEDGSEEECEKLLRTHVLQAGLRILLQSSVRFDERDPVFIMYANQLEMSRR